MSEVTLYPLQTRVPRAMVSSPGVGERVRGEEGARERGREGGRVGRDGGRFVPGLRMKREG